MNLLTQIDNNPKQKIRMLLDNGNNVIFNFEYRPNQQAWFLAFEYGDVNVQNIRLVTSYNLLRGYKSWLPFGLRCDTIDSFEPMDINDFLSGYATLYLLNADDVQATEAIYYGKIST